jgi:hypothetical protein
MVAFDVEACHETGWADGVGALEVVVGRATPTVVHVGEWLERARVVRRLGT